MASALDHRNELVRQAKALGVTSTGKTADLEARIAAAGSAPQQMRPAPRAASNQEGAPEMAGKKAPPVRPAGAVSAREDQGAAVPGQEPTDPDATLPKDGGSTAATTHPEVTSDTIGDPNEPASAQPVSVVRQNATTWWCPNCDNSQTHDFDRCPKCGTAKPKALTKGRKS